MLTATADAVVPAAALAPLDARAARADVAVNLHGAGPESHCVLLAAAPRRLIAFAHPDVAESAGKPEWDDSEHEVHRWCRLLQASGIPADPARLELLPPGRTLPVTAPGEARGATLLHPGAASAARRWPVERWIAVARAERASGRRVVVTGDTAERTLAVAVARGAGLDIASVYAGRTSLVELAALVEAAGRVVCGDTGVAHLAAALGSPSVVLFGPTPPALWGPPPDRPRHRVLWAGRRGDPHAAAPDPGLLAISVDDVLRALAEPVGPLAEVPV